MLEFKFMKFSFIGPILFFLFFQFSLFAIENDFAENKILSSEKISLEKRYENKFVNDVFKDNILLNMAYLRGTIAKKEDIDWEDIDSPFSYKFVLHSGQSFAFHEDVFPKYKESLVKTTNANFNFDDGFKFSGYLVGDGVCHLASLMYLVAKNAGLDAFAPTNHNFAQIPEISPEHGVSVYKMPGSISANSLQNLYITNNKENSVIFEFEYSNKVLKLSIFETKNINI